MNGRKFWYPNLSITTTSTTPPIKTTSSHSIGDESIVVNNMPWHATVYNTKKEYDINLNLPLYKQQHTLSCECAATHAATTYIGHSLSEEHCLETLEVYEGPLQDGIWGDPDVKYVGNVDGSQRRLTGFGVYPKPIEKGLQTYNISVQASYHTSIEKITISLLNNKPVVIWTPYAVGQCWKTSWKTPTGKVIETCRNEHSLVVQGFTGTINNPRTIRIMDVHPGIYREISGNRFQTSWDSLNNMALFF